MGPQRAYVGTTGSRSAAFGRNRAARLTMPLERWAGAITVMQSVAEEEQVKKQDARFLGGSGTHFRYV